MKVWGLFQKQKYIWVTSHGEVVWKLCADQAGVSNIIVVHIEDLRVRINIVFDLWPLPKH